MFYSLILSSVPPCSVHFCLKWESWRWRGVRYMSTLENSSFCYMLVCFGGISVTSLVRQLNLACRRLAVSFHFPSIKPSFWLLNYTNSDHSKSLLVECLYQIFAGSSLATLSDSFTVLHKVCAVFLKAQLIWFWKSWGRNMWAKDHFKVAILCILLLLWLAGCWESDWYFVKLNLTLIIWNASFFTSV